MITIKPSTTGSLIIEIPFCSDAEAKGAGFGKLTEGHTRGIIKESDFDEFLIAVLDARRKFKQSRPAS